jgi:hypothetical protein
MAMMRRATVRLTTILAFAVTCGLAVHSPTHAAPPPAASTAKKPTAAPQGKTVRQLLNQRIATVKFDETPLADAIDFLRDVSGANVHVNWRALEAAGIGKDAPVTTKLKHVSVRKALAVVLSQASPNAPLAYYNDGGVIEITTRALADEQQIVRTYFVGDLIVDVPDFAGPRFNIGESSGGGGKDGGGGGKSLFDQSAGNEENKGTTKSQRANNLVSLITQLIRPDVWEQNGGTAKISYFNGYLIVTAPRSVHEQLGGPVE